MFWKDGLHRSWHCTQTKSDCRFFKKWLRNMMVAKTMVGKCTWIEVFKVFRSEKSFENKNTTKHEDGLDGVSR